MAEKDDKGLIGFDPLAWMNDDESEGSNQQEPQVVEVKNEQVELNDAETATETNEPKASTVTPLVENKMMDSKIVLEHVLNIQNVTVLYDKLLKALESDEVIEIDASAVSSVDTASLQLLAVFKKETIKLLKEVSIDFPSDKFIEAAELLGLAEMLEVDSSAAGFF